MKVYKCDVCGKETWSLICILHGGKVIDFCSKCYKEFKKNKEEIEKLYASA